MNRKIFQTLCVLLALVLMTSTVLASTVARYVTTAYGEDDARVAKWGVTATMTGGAFATKYVDNTTSYDMDVSVKSNNTDKLVAPGTTGTFGGIHVTGKPEVAVKVRTYATMSLANWVVNGSYYCPLKITINGVTYYGMDYSSSAAFCTAVEEAIESADGIYPPNTNLAEVTGLNGDYTWVWDFKGTDGKQTDEKDYIIGENSANGTDALISLSVTTNITQSDGNEGLGDGGDFVLPEEGDEFWG